MFLKTVLADGQAEQAVLREMQARAAGARGDIEQTVLEEAYAACDPVLIAALEKAAANIRDYHEQMLVKS